MKVYLKNIIDILQQVTRPLVLFFTSPLSPEPLGLFRILMAFFAIIQALLWYPDWPVFLGSDGWIQWEISEAISQSWSPHLAKIYGLLEPVGTTQEQVVWGLYWGYLTVAFALLVGWNTKIWAFLTWLFHLIIMSTIPTFVYGVDIFLHIALFYIMVMPASRAFSLDVIAGRVSPHPSWEVTLAIRVLQIHLCLAYLSAGYEKVLVSEWWSGNVLWRSLVQPDFRQYDLTWLAWYPWIIMLCSWFTMIIETGYCAAMWIPRLRVFWLAGIICLHVGIGVFLGLYLFGLIMILLSLSAFGHLALQDIRLWQKERQQKLRAIKPDRIS